MCGEKTSGPLIPDVCAGAWSPASLSLSVLIHNTGLLGERKKITNREHFAGRRMGQKSAAVVSVDADDASFGC